MDDFKVRLKELVKAPADKNAGGDYMPLPGRVYALRSGRLGAGAFGVVYKGRRISDGLEVAIKRTLDTHIDSLLREATILKHVSGIPGVLQIYDDVIVTELVTYDPVTRRNVPIPAAYMVTEFVKGIELFELYSRVLQEEFGSDDKRCAVSDMMVSIMRKSARIVSAINARNVCHNDLKPENIMVLDDDQFDGNVRVIDFGGACFFRLPQEPACKIAGMTETFIAPEMREARRQKRAGQKDLPFDPQTFDYGKCDAYSLGRTFRDMSVGYKFLEGNRANDADEANLTMLEGVDAANWMGTYCEPLNHLIANLMTRDPNIRLAPSQAADILDRLRVEYPLAITRPANPASIGFNPQQSRIRRLQAGDKRKDLP